MYRDIGLARISRDDVRRGLGVGRQERDVRRKSAETGGEIHEMFVENDTPASRFNKKEREKYKRILELLRSGSRDRIIVYRLDRLTRIPRVMEDLIDLCEQRPFLVVNLHGSMDLTSAEGRKQARDRVNDAAFETDLMSERLRDAFDDKAQRGEPHGVRAFGYACNGLRPCKGERCCHDRPCEHQPRHKRCCRVPGCPHDAVTIIEPEAELFRRAAEDLRAGESLNGIAKRWNALGVVTPNNYRQWDGSTVKCVFTNPRHAGLKVHRGEVVGKGVWKPIISEADHEVLKRLLTNRGRRPPSRRTPFTGLIQTPEGKRLVRNVERGKPVYRWQNRPARDGGTNVTIRAEPLEALVVETLFVEVESGRLARRIAERRQRADVKPAGEDPAKVREELVQLAEDKANPDIGLSRAEWLAQRNVLMRRLEAAEAAQETVDTDRVLMDVDLDVRVRWQLPEDEGGYSTDRKRAILASVFDRVVVHPKRLRAPMFDPERIELVWRV